MAVVTIPLTEEQKAKIKSETGMTLDVLAIEKVVGRPVPKIDLTVTEIEDRLNAAIEVPMPQQKVKPGTIYVRVSSKENVVVRASSKKATK